MQHGRKPDPTIAEIRAACAEIRAEHAARMLDRPADEAAALLKSAVRRKRRSSTT